MVASGRRSTRVSGGLVSELVATVRDEVHGITSSANGDNAKTEQSADAATRT